MFALVSERQEPARFLQAGFSSAILGICHIQSAIHDELVWLPPLTLACTLVAIAGLYRAWLKTGRILSAIILGTWTGIVYFAITTHWLGQSANPLPTTFSPVAIPRAALAQLLFFPWWAFAFGTAKTLSRALSAREGAIPALSFVLMFTLADLMLSDLVYGIPLAPFSRVLLDTPFAVLLSLGGMHTANLAILATGLRLPHSTPAGRSSPLHRSWSSGARWASCSNPQVKAVPTRPTPPFFLAQPHFPRPATITEADLARFEDGALARYLTSEIHAIIRRGTVAGADLIVLPENIMPYDLSQDVEQVAAIAGLLPEQTTVVIGFTEARVTQSADGFIARPRNSAAFINSEGLLAIYRKAHLVPFGETMPGVAFALGFDVLAGPSGGYEAGPSIEVFGVGDISPFALLICYESILSGAVSRESDGAEWLLNISSEGLFGTTIGPRLLLDYSRMRSIETDLPMLRSTATAYSAVISSKGEVLDALPLEQSGALVNVVPSASPTLFRFTGYTPLYLVLLCIGVMMVLIRAGTARNHAVPVLEWLIDSLVRRDVRRFGAGREPVFLYHRAKASLLPLTMLPWMVYLALPISLHPLWILLPRAVLLGLAVNLTAGRFKKYL